MEEIGMILMGITLICISYQLATLTKNVNHLIDEIIKMKKNK